MKNNILRTLARSDKYQTLYKKSKDLNLDIFENKKDLTYLQITFLNLCEMYSSLYQDIALGKPYINYKKIKDDILVNAYLIWKHNQNKKSDKNNNKKQNNTGFPSIVFTGGSKK